MKTTFSRQFALIAALLLVCMIFTGVSFRFLMLGYLKTTKKKRSAPTRPPSPRWPRRMTRRASWRKTGISG